MLTAAQALLATPGRWRLTYKPRRLIPATSEEEVGAGGELFVEVDLRTGRSVVAGHGE